jgi:anthranilate phosphoribosyltransferase
VVRDVLADSPGPARRVVVANTAAALLAAGRVDSLRDGVAVADEALRSGRARQVWQRLCRN